MAVEIADSVVQLRCWHAHNPQPFQVLALQPLTAGTLFCGFPHPVYTRQRVFNIRTAISVQNTM